MFELRPYKNNHHMSAYDPFREFEEMEKAFFGDNDFWGRNMISEFKTDIQDNGDEYLLEADLPGFNKGDIQIDIDGDYLTIKAERHSEHEKKDKKGNYLRCERSYGSYSRGFDISGVKSDEIKASYENGVLKLTMPKKTETVSTAHRLEIE